MTVGACIQQINKLLFDEDLEKMSCVGMGIIKTLKDHFQSKNYPRRGWLLLFEEDDLYMSNGEVRIRVPVDPSQRASVLDFRTQ